MKDNHRTFTTLGWLFSLICMPTGMFIGLATGRVISWKKAVAWFVLFFVLQICFARGMAHLESVEAAQVVIQLFLVTGLTTFGLSLFLIHNYGVREDYWSERDKMAWLILGRVGCFLLLLNLISIMTQWVVIPLWIQPLLKPAT